MAKAKKIVTRWSDGQTPIEELTPIDRIAHEIVSAFSDLAPSIERIFSADLNDDERHVALTSFQISLDRTGDPNRDPRVAISNAKGS